MLGPTDAGLTLDLPHLGKQLQAPHISFSSLPSNFTNTKDHGLLAS